MLPYGRKNPLSFPLFRSGHMSAICARPFPKEVGVKRVETLVSTLLPRRGARRIPALRRAQLPAESQRRTPRPSGANTLTRFVHHGFPVQKRSRPSGANTLAQFAYPGHSVPRTPGRSAVLGKSKNPIPNGTGFCTSLYMCSGISPER